MEWTPRSCPVCGSGYRLRLYAPAKFDSSALNEFSYASRKVPDGMHFELQRCENCQLVYVSKAPASDWVANQYHTADFDATEESGFAADTYVRYLSEHADMLPDRQMAVDIGAGDGAFLARVMDQLQFADCLGYEPSKAPIELARADIKPKLANRLFDGSDLAPGSVSLVTCFQTLEHVDNPQDLLIKVFDLLKPGGVFMTISHNVDSPMVKLLGTKSPIFDIEHLQLFNHHSLRHALGKAGFEQLRSGPVKNRYPLDYWARLAPLPKPVKSFGQSLLSLTRLGRVPLPFYPGNLYGFGRKPVA